ncbi:unnamed protein product [Arctia plantaginis]|uniref:MORN repeat-containing protein 5 n=1 Tax=Arctia plantaginis TaxID=874455 RepID=A0A8S1B8I3_ARCPL|nr:unnamed protein product [Arctia plantaginis]
MQCLLPSAVFLATANKTRLFVDKVQYFLFKPFWCKMLCSPTCCSEKRVSQWDELMRKFSREHEKECRQTILKIPQAYRSTKFFPTGSQYEGSWDILGMSGSGTYTFPNGVIYEGDFEDGMFHGAGQLEYPDGTLVTGVFKKGVITNRKLIFPDGLIYEEQNWGYCKMPDRRYTAEYDNGIEPAGRSNITAEMPPREIPPGFYDTGDGFYDPKTLSVYKADDLSCVLRSPSEHEQKWIVANCRTAPETVLGPRIDLYEEWMVPALQLPQPPPPAASTQMMMMNAKRSTHASYASASSADMRDTFGAHRPHKLSTYQGYEASNDTSVSRDQSIASKLTHTSQRLDKVKSNTKSENTKLKFSTVPKNYSDLFSRNINVALATLFQNPKDPAFKHSDNKTDKKVTEFETYKDQYVQMPTMPKRFCGVLPDDSVDILPSQASCFKYDEDSDAKVLVKPQSKGITSSLLMFSTVANANEDKITSRKPSKKISEV